jgi:hypothetical protein
MSLRFVPRVVLVLAAPLLLYAAPGLGGQAFAADAAARKYDWLPRHKDTVLRAVSWNVSRFSFTEQPEEFRRVLDRIDADLLVLDEMPPDLSGPEIAAQLPASGQEWHVVYGSAGGRQRASISARFELLRAPDFDQLAYPAELIDAWLADIEPELQARDRAQLQSGVAAAGAMFELDGRRLLVAGVDLQCCGDGPDSLPEARRRFEAGAVRDAAERAIARLAVDAVLIAGDLNAVNGPMPVDILRGVGSTGMLLAAAEATHRGSDLTWTWDGRGTPYPSGRLDYILHSDALVVLQSQVFDTEDLSDSELELLGLDAELSRTLTDHRPVVVDFGWR